MRKLYLARREDRIITAPADVMAETRLQPPRVRAGDLIFSFPELKVGIWLARQYSERDGIDYVFALTRDADQAAFIIPVADVQEIPEPDYLPDTITILQ